ncbi:MAG: hypothetical protein ACE5G1_03760 [bacterium]
MSKISANKSGEKRGFTTAEKWIIWGVFCLLVGLSTYRLAVFLGLMVLSAGVWLFMKRQKMFIAVILSIIGILTLGFSKFLI